jgi:hypothetical protein
VATAAFIVAAPRGEWHHFYLGAGLAGWAVLRRRPWLLLVASLIALDDGWQHLKQLAGDADYRSPLHQLFALYLWPHPAVQWVVARLDALFA